MVARFFWEWVVRANRPKLVVQSAGKYPRLSEVARGSDTVIRTRIIKMNKKPYIASIILCVLLSSISVVSKAEIIYYNGFETMPLGLADDRTVKDYWATRYAKGPDEGRIEIVTNGYLGQGGRVLYPSFSHSTGDSGNTWETNLFASEEHLFMAYWVKLDDDFQCVKGGKLPGFAGSESFPHGEYSWSARLMWREDCRLEWYLHDFALSDLQGNDPYRVFWDDNGIHAKLIPGQWHHLELMIRLNTPGQRDGRLQGWLDGVMVSDDFENSGIRGSGQGDVKINELFFSTFFGGSSAPVTQWQPTEDVYATFDEFTVATQRIGVEGGGQGNGDDNSGGGSGELSCDTTLTVPWGEKTEIELASNTGTCLSFEGRSLSNETVAVWDSDQNSSCDFVGTLRSVDGSGELIVTDSYEATQNLTGTVLSVSPRSSCLFMIVRAR